VDYDDHGLAALPKLVGGPKYSRPPVTGLERAERPPDPDDLPLVSQRTPEDSALAAELGLESAHAVVTASNAAGASVTEAGRSVVHPNGTWSLGSRTSAEPASLRRGFGRLFRGKNSRSGAS
jgi:hypothetical protein